MISISQNGLQNVERNLRRMGSGVRQETRAAVERAVRTVEADLKRVGLTGQKGQSAIFGVTGAAGDRLGVRSGRTRRFVTARVLDVGPTVVGVVGSPEKHMRLHEEGGTVHGSQYLRIPTRRAQTGVGVDRYAGMSIRNIPGAFLIRGSSGKLWAAVREAGNLQFLYLLVRQVRMRARRVFAKTLDRNRPAINAELSKAVTRIVARGNGGA